MQEQIPLKCFSTAEWRVIPLFKGEEKAAPYIPASLPLLAAVSFVFSFIDLFMDFHEDLLQLIRNSVLIAHRA